MSDKNKKCVCCNEEGNLQCSNCKIVFYCSRQCQVKDWKLHKSICNKDSNKNIENDDIKKMIVNDDNNNDEIGFQKLFCKKVNESITGEKLDDDDVKLFKLQRFLKHFDKINLEKLEQKKKDKDEDEKVSSKLTKKHCANCLKELDHSLCCSRCMTARYCNERCQKMNWPAHKSVCEDSNRECNVLAKAHNYKSQGNNKKAEKYYRKVMSIISESESESVESKVDGDLYRSLIMNALASCCTRNGKYKEAAQILKESLDRGIGLDTDHTVTTLQLTAENFRCESNFHEAERLLLQCMDLTEQKYGVNHYELMELLNDLVSVIITTVTIIFTIIIIL